MANAFKNTDLITKFAVKAFKNALAMGEKVDRQLDEQAIFDGKIGATVRVRRPVEFTVSDGARIVAGDIEDIEEATVSVTLDQRKKVAFTISSVDKTLKVEDINERYIKPAMKRLAQNVESAIADQYKYIYNFVGTPGSLPSTFLDVANAGSKLDELGVPDDGTRSAFYGPAETVTLSNGLKAVFPQKIATRAIEQATIGMYGSFMLYKNQSLKLHTVGVASGTPLVNGANQNVTYAASKDTNTQSLITDGWTGSQTGILKAGDIFTLANVYSVNRETKQSTGNLAQFVVTADADSDAGGNATFTISPPIIIDGPYQTVTAAPANNAVITVVTGTGGTAYRQNMAWHKNAITLAFAQLDTPEDGATSSRQNYEGISIRATRQYDISLDETIYRFDILYGLKVQNPGFAVRTTS